MNFFFRTLKFVVLMQSHNNLRFDDPAAPVKAKRREEVSGNPKAKRRPF